MNYKEERTKDIRGREKLNRKRSEEGDNTNAEKEEEKKPDEKTKKKGEN
jgi:hypothetical protein